MEIENFIKKLKEYKRELEHTLLTNQVENFTEYKYLVGKIRGVQDALEIWNTVVNRNINKKEEDL